MDNPGDAKYGMTTEQIFQAFKILKSKGAKHFGIHAFLASNTVTNDYYPLLARKLFELAVKLKEETGPTFPLSIFPEEWESPTARTRSLMISV